MVPGNKGVDANNIQYQQFAADVARVLAANGFVATDRKDADLGIVLEYGIGPAKEHSATSYFPIIGQTGVSSSTTSGTFDNNGASTSFTGTTTYTPSIGVTGVVPKTHTYTTHDMHVALFAYDWRAYVNAQRKTDARMLWKTIIDGTGPTGDIRFVFPVFVAAAAPYLAKDTGKAVDVEMDGDEDSVLAVQGQGDNPKQTLKDYVTGDSDDSDD